MPNYQFITENQFDKVEPNFISFPDFIYNYIQEYIYANTFVKMQQKLKWKVFDKTAFLYKINSIVFIQDLNDSRRMYWLYTDGKYFYIVDFLTDGGASIEEGNYIKGTDEDTIHYLILMGVIKPTMYSDFLYDYDMWKKKETATNRDRKINQIFG